MSLNIAVQQLASGAAAYLGGLIIVKEQSGRLLHYDKVGLMAIGLSLCCLYIARKIKPSADQN
jgi:predicted MFS family arabinose efflux permease